MVDPVPTLYVVGRAEREVYPDQVVVAIEVRTPLRPAPAEALADGAAARRRLLDHLGAAHPAAPVGDARITTVAEQVRATTDVGGGRIEERWEVVGHRGACRITVEGPAADAAALVASAGSHPDAERVVPVFVVGPDLERRLALALEQEAVRDALARADGLAAAADMSVAGVLAIGEPPRSGEDRVFAAMSGPMSAAGDLADEIGELRPDPVTRAARVPVRLALEPAGGSQSTPAAGGGT